MKGHYKKYAVVGVGGVKCPCCGGDRHGRVKILRQAKRRERRAVRKEISTIIGAGHENI